jgi:hypothetical protein
MIEVKPRGQFQSDRAGDPLDGLVNMFDLGIVLAVAFLIAALQSHDLTQVLTKQAPSGATGPSIVLKNNQQLQPLKPGETRVPVKGGVSLGTVYELPDGQKVYVTTKK